MRSQAEADILETVSKSVEKGIIIAFVLPFCLQVIIKGVMSKLWLWVNMI